MDFNMDWYSNSNNSSHQTYDYPSKQYQPESLQSMSLNVYEQAKYPREACRNYFYVDDESKNVKQGFIYKDYTEWVSDKTTIANNVSEYLRNEFK